MIPREVRDSMGLRPGQWVQVVAYDDRIELVPEKEMATMRGFLAGIDTKIEREKDRL